MTCVALFQLVVKTAIPVCDCVLIFILNSIQYVAVGISECRTPIWNTVLWIVQHHIIMCLGICV